MKTDNLETVTDFAKSSIFIVGAMLICRMVGLPANVTPIIAIAVFLPTIVQNRAAIIAVLIAGMFLSDIIIGMHSTAPIIYGVIALCGVLSATYFSNMYIASAAGVAIWHVVVNGAVYFQGLGFPTLAQTYAAAVPFDVRLLVSTMAFVFIFTAAHRLASYLNNIMLHKLLD